jgi:hypothetical protein
MNQIVAVKLPNGTLQVIKSTCGHVNEVFQNESSLYSTFQAINEGVTPQIQILDSINE